MGLLRVAGVARVASIRPEMHWRSEGEPDKAY